MTKKTLIKTFNWGWLTGSEIQSIIIKVGSIQASMVQEEELRVLHLHLKAARKILATRELGLGSLKKDLFIYLFIYLFIVSTL